MRNLTRWLARGLAALAGLGLLYVVFVFVFLDFVIDFWWFLSLDFGAYFWQRLTYRYVILGGVTAFFCLAFFLNFWVASRYLGTSSRHAETEGQGKAAGRRRSLVRGLRVGSMRVYTPLSLVLGVIIALPLFRGWEDALLAFFGPISTGATDPFFGNDVAYYLFRLPVYNLVVGRLSLAFLVLFGALLFLYWLEHRLLSKEERRLPRGARLHLSLVAAALFGCVVWRLLLSRQMLLFSGNHPLFFGPGFTEMQVVRPLIWVVIGLFAAAGVLFIWFVNTGKGLKATAVAALLALAALGVRESAFFPDLVQKYIVKPNELTREHPYIANSVSATLAAYNLSNVETREYALKEVPLLSSAPDIAASIRNIPVWNGELLLDVYRQLQKIRPYYEFADMTVDRYMVGGRKQQVFLSAREISLDNLPDSAKNWVNEHLRYTHGYGVVMTPAAQGGDEPMVWFIKDIPPASAYGFKMGEPSIYFGLGAYSYAIAPNASGEFGYPEAGGSVETTYTGTGGLPLSTLFRKAMFAVYFQDRNIFFTTKTKEESRILFRRNILDRVKRITPFLRLDSTPYVVTTPRGIFWIQDAYTTSHSYPNAQPSEEGFNYIRNSVKIVIDAYNGFVSYYISDPSDPIIRAYRRIYPGLLKDMSEMPGDLRPHVRYPRDIFQIQMGVYAKYHQTDPETFYNQEDAWTFARTIYHGNQPVTVPPYYVTLNLIRPGSHDFTLLDAMSPRSLDTLRALVVAGNDGPDYGRLIAYRFPKGTQVLGPSQINALIDQDTVIAQQFTLWNQVGSEVERGKMIILPVGGTILYIQPVYLKSSARLKIPELKRIIVSQGDLVVMDTTVEDCFKQIEDRLRERQQRIQRRLDLFPQTETKTQ